MFVLDGSVRWLVSHLPTGLHDDHGLTNVGAMVKRVPDFLGQSFGSWPWQELLQLVPPHPIDQQMSSCYHSFQILTQSYNSKVTPIVTLHAHKIGEAVLLYVLEQHSKRLSQIVFSCSEQLQKSSGPSVCMSVCRSYTFVKKWQIVTKTYLPSNLCDSSDSSYSCGSNDSGDISESSEQKTFFLQKKKTFFSRRSGQILNILWFFNRGPANYQLLCDWPTSKQFCDFLSSKTSLWYFLSVVFSVFFVGYNSVLHFLISFLVLSSCF